MIEAQLESIALSLEKIEDHLSTIADFMVGMEPPAVEHESAPTPEPQPAPAPAPEPVQETKPAKKKAAKKAKVTPITPAAVETVSIEALREKMLHIAQKMGDPSAISKLLMAHGANKISEVPEAKYAVIMQELTQLEEKANAG